MPFFYLVNAAIKYRVLVADEYHMNWPVILLLFIFIIGPAELKASALDKFLKRHNIFIDKKDIKEHSYKLEREEVLRNDNVCAHCPKHLLLTEQVNKVIDSMIKDPKSDLSSDVPIKLNGLKFLYYTQALTFADGKKDCRRFMELETPDLKPTKFDGQFHLIAEDVLKFSDVTTIQYFNPDLDEVVYYYRGEGAQKDLIVQAILTKEGGKFRYFKYLPTKKEENPYNLPDLGKSEPGPVAQIIEAASPKKEEVKEKSEEGKLYGDDSMSVKFKADVEKQYKVLPKNVHFMEAKLNQEVTDGIRLTGHSNASLKGNEAKLSLIDSSGRELFLYDVETKITGKTRQKIVVPYEVRTFEDQNINAKGRVEIQKDTQILTMSLAGGAIEYIRGEYRNNRGNNTDSYVLARDIKISPSEHVSVQYAKGEDNKRYASLKHVKNIKDKITMVLDVKVDEDRRATLMYHLNAKF